MQTPKATRLNNGPGQAGRGSQSRYKPKQIEQRADASTQSWMHQHDELPPMTTGQKVRMFIGLALFLILYTIAGSAAPVVWTPSGTIPLP